MLKNTFIKKIKQQLLEEKEGLLKKSTIPTEIDLDGDETDEIQGKMILHLENQLNLRNKDKIFKINDALKKIEEKTYGICQDCEEDIPEKRLMFNPYFLTCIGCAEDREEEDKKSRLL